jgi:hypothetical protein
MQTMRTTISRFGRRNGASGMTSREPMTLDTLRAVAPSVFAGGKHDSRSERYTYIPTAQIVEHLMKRDYGVFSAMQGGSRLEGKRDYTKHLLRLRPLSQPTQVGGTHNEIVLINSHDGTSAYRLMAGIFRMVCGNGLVVAESTIEDVRVKHSGAILSDVAAGVERISGQLPALADRVQGMQAITLAPDEQRVFAAAALTARYGVEAPITPEQILSTRRQEDKAPDLWSTLNVTQENILRGGNRYRVETKRGTTQRRKTGAVNSVDGQTNINRALWQLAEEMRRLKTVA